MKCKLVFLVLIGLVVSTKGFSQDDTPLTVGAQVNISESFLSNSFLKDSYKMKFGFAPGIFAEYRIIDMVSAGIGLQYHWTGTNGIATDQIFFDSEAIVRGGTIKKVDLKMQRLEIPIYGRVHFGSLNVLGGISYNFIYNSKAKVTEVLLGAEGTTTLDAEKRLARDELTIFIGAGYTMEIAGLKIIPEIKYNLGTTTINNMVLKDELYSNNIMIGVKVGYPLALSLF